MGWFGRAVVASTSDVVQLEVGSLSASVNPSTPTSSEISVSQDLTTPLVESSSVENVSPSSVDVFPMAAGTTLRIDVLTTMVKSGALTDAPGSKVLMSGPVEPGFMADSVDIGDEVTYPVGVRLATTEVVLDEEIKGRSAFFPGMSLRSLPCKSTIAATRVS